MPEYGEEVSALAMISLLNTELTLWAIGCCPHIGCIELPPSDGIFCADHDSVAPVDIVDQA